MLTTENVRDILVVADKYCMDEVLRAGGFARSSMEMGLVLLIYVQVFQV